MPENDVLVEKVRVSVDINSIDKSEDSIISRDLAFRPTYVQVERTNGTSTAHAKVKGIMTQPDELSNDDIISVYVTDDPDVEQNQLMFRGRIKKATQNNEGVVTVEAYDARYRLRDELVLSNTDLMYSSDFAAKILEDAGFTVVRDGDPEDVSPGLAYVAQPEEFFGDDTQSKHKHGSGERGDPAIPVLEKLAKKAGGVFWVDKRNVVRFEPYPNVDRYEVRYIIEIEPGEDSVATNRVLVEGGGAAGDLGLAGSSVYNQVSLNSASELPTGDDDGPNVKEGEIVVKDRSSITQRETDKRAVGEMLAQSNKATAGTIRISGNASVEPFDIVRVDNLEAKFGADLTQFSPFVSDLLRNEYTVKSVTHTIDLQEGFTTDLDLTPAHKEILEIIEGPAGYLGDLFARQLENHTHEGGELALVHDTIENKR